MEYFDFHGKKFEIDDTENKEKKFFFFLFFPIFHKFKQTLFGFDIKIFDKTKLISYYILLTLVTKVKRYLTPFGLITL